ncbi:increased rDNA silencing protein 4-like [Haliotis rubra]|uniref:increased rDNA silencing protein 4-like n=1 Tax=Haliotis rubra TaxID=36100 RepID=UPI001EE525AC|nr:increased rDNA silencing protein 4-like [Haliotis rubra]
MVFGGGITAAAAADDDWFVEGSDEEGSTDEQKDAPVEWTPDAKDILAMFEKLDKDKVLELRWKCPGRRPPSPRRKAAPTTMLEMRKICTVTMTPRMKRAPEISEFDFDDFGSEASAKPTPRRTPGSKTTPRSQKKVASMHNVLNKIRHEQIEKAAIKEARRGMSRSPASPARFRLGMSGSPGPGGSRRPVSSTGTPLRPSYEPSDDPFPPSTSLFRDSKVPQAPTEMPSAPELKREPADPPTSETKPND